MALDWEHRAQSAVARLVSLGHTLDPVARAELAAIVGELGAVMSHAVTELDADARG